MLTVTKTRVSVLHDSREISVTHKTNQNFFYEIPICAKRSPVASPVFSHVAAPVFSPGTASVFSPVAAPVFSPVAAPVFSPGTAPVFSPVAAPVFSSGTAPEPRVAGTMAECRRGSMADLNDVFCGILIYFNSGILWYSAAYSGFLISFHTDQSRIRPQGFKAAHLPNGTFHR